MTSFVANCAEPLPATDYQAKETWAISPDTPSALFNALKDEVAQHPGKSGFHLITSGGEAFQRRIATMRAAEKTVDLQYYIVGDDGSGKIMLEEMLRAADRGVRIRLLVDDINTSKISDEIAVLNTHDNIEIRIFNPAATRDEGIIARITNYVTDLPRIMRRMHNKSLIADNQVAITGGRNLGDEYFEASEKLNFSDVDILTVGPITYGISKSFDKYWNSDKAYPLRALNLPRPTDETISRVRESLKQNWIEAHESERGQFLRQSHLADQLGKDQVSLIWAPASLAVDEPDKIDSAADNAESKPAERLDKLVENAKSEFIAITPYFVPREEGVDWLKAMVDRGIRVRVLTNSLASTDVAAVHSGYRRYRRPLLEAGVELYEMKPEPGRPVKQKLRGSYSPASLHAKVYVVDRKDVVVSSFNLDPRSIELNTEIAVTIHSPELAAEILKIFENSVLPANSYHVMLQEVEQNKANMTPAKRQNMTWVTEEDGRKITFDSEPPAKFWSETLLTIFSILPVEDQL